MSYYFISDLHLAENRPDITELFLRFLNNLEQECTGLYILGDFFSYWIGDDDPSPWLQPIKQALKSTADKGIPTYFMVGNRDFAIDKQFCREAGMTLLTDPCVVELYDQRIVLLHGDSLCTDDKGYQKYRAIIRHPITLFILRSLPLSWRLALANKLRGASKDKQQQMIADGQNMASLDVNLQAASECMNDWQVDLMIHGHTHKPKIHSSARNQSRGTRIVLGDWYTQGSVLELTEDGFSLFSLPLPELVDAV